MASITDLLFHPLSNAIMTVLTGVTAIYWITTFIAGDLFGDAGVDTDVPVHGADVDTDVDADADDAGGDKSFFQKALEFVNIGKVPFMVVYSVFKFIAWIITLTSSVFLGLTSWGWKSVVILIPVFFVAYLVTRYVTKPLIKVYDAMGYNGEEPQELLGRIARMRSTISGDTIGAAEVKIQSDIIRINVKSKTGESIAYDAEVMITDESSDKKFYLVVPEITLSNIV
jgi:membrane protein implicated in regulation of membrane protease activity